MAIFRDITAERAHEDDLTAFAGVVAHDLKAPLATIGSYAELTAEEINEQLPGPDGDAARHGLSRVNAAVTRAGQLIDDLLTYTTTREARLNPQSIDLDELVREVAAERTGYRRTGPMPPEISVGPLGKVSADPGMLRRVLDNLVGNALKYVPPGEPARILVTAQPDGSAGWVRLEVADRGIGIPDADKPHVFDAFHRAHRAAGYAGTGLGLAICRRIVERHGGTIAIADNPGGGTRVIVTLPAA
jgi:signal transduction histidine kinase